MRYRALDANGDYTFGQNGANFLIDSPAAVGQAVLTTLLLLQGEWFLDSTVGVPYNTGILGTGTEGTYDYVIQTAILSVTGVTSIAEYTSSVTNRQLSISALINTEYGQVTVTTTLPV